jgi:phosphoglycolate phosphatase-like HAD superfamily hydrolase
MSLTTVATQTFETNLARAEISHVIFDFDGTLSWLRHGWPTMMCELFLEHVPLRRGETREMLKEALTRDILALNGKPSVYQMQLCVQAAEQRGAQKVDAEKLLLEYQQRLDSEIESRTKRILNAMVERDHFVIHRARALIEQLKERGLTMIILSGTAEPRVKQEAELLDLTRYFHPHIYGGTADLAQSSKRAVIERLLREENLEGKHLLAFGDGPVEIQLTKEAGGLAIGVASDEEENGSGRLDPQKLTQLRAAGADLLIPDYRDPDLLLKRLLGK